jgi:hypothetical protein
MTSLAFMFSVLRWYCLGAGSGNGLDWRGWWHVHRHTFIIFCALFLRADPGLF